MYCAQLLEISELTEQQITVIDNFLKNVLPNGYATVSNAVSITGIEEKVIADTFSKLYLFGFLDIVYAVRCPECGHMIKKIDDIGCFDYETLKFCYSCDEPIDLSDKDIVALFKRKNKSPFVKGQHYCNIEMYSNNNVAPNDSITYLRKISYSFDNICNLVGRKLVQDDEEKRQNVKIEIAKDSAYRRYKKNKRIFAFWTSFFRIVSLVILFFILIESEKVGVVSDIISVVTFAFVNVIDVILKNYITTGLAELEREEIYNMLHKKE